MRASISTKPNPLTAAHEPPNKAKTGKKMFTTKAFLEKKTGRIWLVDTHMGVHQDEHGVCFYTIRTYDEKCRRHTTFRTAEQLEDKSIYLEIDEGCRKLQVNSDWPSQPTIERPSEFVSQRDLTDEEKEYASKLLVDTLDKQ